MKKTRIGVVGCGNISDIYLKNLTSVFENTQVYAVSDLDRSRAEASAARYGVPHVMDVEELLACPEVEIVLNITIPAAHFEICEKALLHGKHVYVEKPLSVTVSQAERLVKLAEDKGLYLGCAPDTFLGGGIQTCVELIRKGEIGRPVAATAFFAHHGPERFHPDPAFLYQEGAGPMLDIGPYFITALVSMLGPAQEVCGIAGSGFAERVITSESPKRGQSFPVETPSHVTGSVRFQSGAIATVLTSFDLWDHTLPFIEIYGTKGTLRVPNPDTFGGPVYLMREGEQGFAQIPLSHGYSENSRGIGVSDMAHSIENNVKGKASGEMALHVLEVLKAFLESSEKREYVSLKTTCNMPDALDAGAIL